MNVAQALSKPNKYTAVDKGKKAVLIRSMDASLWREAKAQAARRGVTLQEFVAAAVRAAVARRAA